MAQFCRIRRNIKRSRRNNVITDSKKKLIECKAQVAPGIMPREQRVFFNAFPFAPLAAFTHPSFRAMETALKKMHIDEDFARSNDPSLEWSSVKERYRVFFPNAKEIPEDYADYPFDWTMIPNVGFPHNIPYLKKIEMESPTITYRKISNKPELAHLQPKKCPKKNIADSKLTTIYSKH